MEGIFGYGELAQSTVDAICNAGAWHRAVSIDLETKIEKKGDFLSGERLLGIGFARRAGGEVETKTLRLKDDTDEAEVALLEEAARYLHTVKPLLLLGYNISGYDYPLLALKVKWYDDRGRAACKEGEKPVFPREYWALKDALTRAFVLDMMHSLRYDMAKHDGSTAKYRSLAYSVAHPMYAHVPLMRRKGLADAEAQAGTDKQMDKGKKIYEMWKSRDAAFESYLEGDVHDVLLLAEEIYGVAHTGGRK
jgi:DNA polymerase elongation subunit (family B)